MSNEIKRTRIELIDKEIEKLQIERNSLIKDLNKVHENEMVNKFLNTYNGKLLLEKYDLDENGIWDVKGENENTGIFGPRNNPFIGRVEGTLEKVLIWAVEQPKFWTWGGGGLIISHKESEIKILKL